MKVALPCAVLPSDAREQAARRMGISVDEVADIAYGYRAWRDGKILDETTFYDAYPDDDFGAFTGADVVPRELTIREVEVPRDPRALLIPPIRAEDVVAANVVAVADHLGRMEELNAPGILMRQGRHFIQAACEAAPQYVKWQPLSELMTGRPADPGAAGAPLPMFAVPLGRESEAAHPRDCAFLGAGFLVQFRFASVVLGPDGEVRDVFATCGLRPVGSDDRYGLFVCGGGPTADTGHFGAQAFVRDIVEHRWLNGAMPESLPRFVAGTIGDLKWSLVVDVGKGGGYRMAPHWLGDQCGNTFNSACGRFAWDGTRFVLEAATGAAVLDAGDLYGDVVSFAKAKTGWRFVMLQVPDEDHEEGPVTLRILDERGASIRELGDFDHQTAVALSADGERLLHVTKQRLSVLDADSGRRVEPSIDLRPLQAVLAIPEDVDLWRRLAAAFAVPAALAGATPSQAREAIEDTWGEEPTDDELAVAIHVASTRPAMPSALPRLDE